MEVATKGIGRMTVAAFVARATPLACDETDWRTDDRVPMSNRDGVVVALLLGALVFVYIAWICAMLVPLPKDGASLEERGERHLVGDGKRGERRERDVDAAVLDDAQVLRVESDHLGSLFLGQLALLPKLSEPKSEAALCGRDRLLESRTLPHLRRSVISR